MKIFRRHNEAVMSRWIQIKTTKNSETWSNFNLLLSMTKQCSICDQTIALSTHRPRYTSSLPIGRRSNEV
uniref:Uncharacterized protein n=1 Tax=Ciona intestinalis TaxID=7719 RepID=H2XT37_CIOIN